MKKLPLLLAAGALLAAPAWGKPFHRALVLSGGGFQSPMYLGMLDGAIAAGKAPDLVIGACGASMAAAIAAALPSNEARRNKIVSAEFHSLLARARIHSQGWDGGGFAHLFGSLLGIYADAWLGRVPDVFDDYMLDTPDDFEELGISSPFPTSGPTRFIIIASRLEFAPADVRALRRGRKLFREVYFTDPETAKLLRGRPSPIASEFPESAVAPITDVVTGVPAERAARASIGNPHVMKPFPVDGRLYLAGSIDLYPIELAHDLADEVVMGFSPGFDPLIEKPAIQGVFGYDPIERTHHVTDSEADAWIDLSDDHQLFREAGFNPTTEARNLLTSGELMMTDVPADPTEFLRRVRTLWAFGRERAIEALSRSERGDKSHIRHLYEGNSSSRLRKELGR